MDENTPAKRKLISYIRKENPNIANESLSDLLNNIKRFVTVVQKIYVEPQAKIKIIEREIKGKKNKDRIIETDFEELKKVFDKKGKTYHFNFDSFRKFNEIVTKGKKDV